MSKADVIRRAAPLLIALVENTEARERAAAEALSGTSPVSTSVVGSDRGDFSGGAA